jgi:hypothetical protein
VLLPADDDVVETRFVIELLNEELLDVDAEVI